MSNFVERFGRDAVAGMQRDAAGCDPLVADDFPSLVERGPADGFAVLKSADESVSEEEDAYWREMHLRHLSEGGGVDHDDADPANWVHRSSAPAIEPEGGFLATALERLEADFQRIVGRVVKA